MFSLVRSLTLRYLIQKWDRSLLVAISIALGVTMFVSSRLLNQCTEAAARDTTIPIDVADLYVTSGEHGVDWGIADEIRKARSAELPAADPLVAGAAVPAAPTAAPGAAAPQTVKVALFTNIALGDAP